MNATDVLDILRDAVVVTLKIAGPVLLLTLAVGLVVSVVQTLTQVQEASLTFVPKVLAVFLSLLFLMPFMLSTLVAFTHQIADRIIGLGVGG